jgi:hypothetical protein
MVGKPNMLSAAKHGDVALAPSYPLPKNVQRRPFRGFFKTRQDLQQKKSFDMHGCGSKLSEMPAAG